MGEGAERSNMATDSESYDCDRCDAAFPITETHTEIVRRDFVGAPQPSRVERFCADCWEAYVEDFLGRDFEDVLASYGVEAES